VKISLQKEKIFTSYSSKRINMQNRERTQKNLNTKRTNNPMNKCAKELNTQFSKEEVQMKKCPSSLSNASQKATETPSSPVRMAEGEPLYIVQSLWKSVCWFLKKLKMKQKHIIPPYCSWVYT
jgi:hypothetical protein